MAKEEIHISDIRSFKACRRKWWWSSPLGRNLEPVIPYAPFFSGRAVHYALEMYYGEDHTPIPASLDKFFAYEEKAAEESTGKLWPMERQIFNEQVELVRGIMNHYAMWTKGFEGRNADSNLKFVSVESSFSVPIYAKTGRKSTKVFLAGRFDGLVQRIDDGTYWIWENKTTRSIKELSESLINDEQCGAYIWAAQRMYGVPIAGVMYNLLRKKVPTEPMVLKNGFLSVNKQCDTTPTAYFEAIRKNHPDWDIATIREYYGEFLDALIEKGETFFARVPVYRTEIEIAELASNLHATALEMTRSQTVRYPAPTPFGCKLCHFRGPCLTMNAGGNVEFILENEYQPRGDPNAWRNDEEGENEAQAS